jgi:hypothetical protein
MSCLLRHVMPVVSCTVSCCTSGSPAMMSLKVNLPAVSDAHPQSSCAVACRLAGGSRLDGLHGEAAVSQYAVAYIQICILSRSLAPACHPLPVSSLVSLVLSWGTPVILSGWYTIVACRSQHGEAAVSHG